MNQNGDRDDATRRRFLGTAAALGAAALAGCAGDDGGEPTDDESTTGTAGQRGRTERCRGAQEPPPRRVVAVAVLVHLRSRPVTRRSSVFSEL